MMFPDENSSTKTPGNQQEGHKIQKTECPQGIIDEASKVDFQCFKCIFDGANGERSPNNVFNNGKKLKKGPHNT